MGEFDGSVEGEGDDVGVCDGGDSEIFGDG